MERRLDEGGTEAVVEGMTAWLVAPHLYREGLGWGW